MKYLAVAVVSLALVAVCMAQDKEDSVGDIKVKVSGTSGKIQVTRSADGNSTTKAKTVTIELDALTEVDKDGTEIKVTGGGAKHSFNSFASQKFTMTDPMDGKITDSTIDAKKIGFSGKLKDLPSTLKADIFIAKAEGKITLDGEESEVDKGSVKFTLDLSKWSFCKKGEAGCSADGEYVDLTMAIKTPGGKEPSTKGGEAKKAKEFDLGDGAEMQLSSKVKLDGSWTNMPQGYPKVERKGARDLMTFRFAKFNDTAYYDPTVSIESDDPASGSTSVISCLVLLFASTLLALGLY